MNSWVRNSMANETLTMPPVLYLTALLSRHRMFSMSHCLSVMTHGHMSSGSGSTTILVSDCRQLMHSMGTRMASRTSKLSIIGCKAMPLLALVKSRHRLMDIFMKVDIDMRLSRVPTKLVKTVSLIARCRSTVAAGGALMAAMRSDRSNSMLMPTDCNGVLRSCATLPIMERNLTRSSSISRLSFSACTHMNH